MSKDKETFDLKYYLDKIEEEIEKYGLTIQWNDDSDLPSNYDLMLLVNDLLKELYRRGWYDGFDKGKEAGIDDSRGRYICDDYYGPPDFKKAWYERR